MTAKAILIAIDHTVPVHPDIDRTLWAV